MKYLFLTFLIFSVIYLASFYKRPNESFHFFDRTHTNYIKGLAILLVILSHTGGQFGIRYLTPLGGTGVAMFFISSGYGLSESFKKKGLANYWRNKFRNVWIPYFILQTVVMIISVLFYSKSFSFSDYLFDITLLDYNHPFGWYMQFIFVWYFIFYIVSKIKFLSNQGKIILFGVISLLTIFLPNQLWAEQALSIFIGILFSYNKESLKVQGNKFFMAGFISVGFIFLIAKQFDFIRNLPWILSNVNKLLIKLPLAIGICLFIYQFQILFKNNMFIYFSKFSFSLYLIHAYTIGILVNPSLLNIFNFLATTLISTFLFDKTLKIYYSINLTKTKVPV